MDNLPFRDADPSSNGQHAHDQQEWLETLVRSVAHLAAQLTMTQIRLRGLATELAGTGAADDAAVSARVSAIAAAETATYLRENLGETLADVIDLDTLEQDVIAFLDGA